MSTPSRGSAPRAPFSLLLAFAFVALACGGCRPASAVVGADGVVEVSSSAALVRLDGGWEARPGTSSERPDVVGASAGGAWRAVEMPASFRVQGVGFAAAPGDSEGVWYRLRLRLDARGQLSGVLPAITSPYRLYAVQPSGRVDVLAESRMRSAPERWRVRHVFALPPGEAVTLVWFVGATGETLSGPYRVPRIGPPGAVARGETAHIALVFGALGAFGMLLMGALVVWRRRPDDLRPFALTLLAGVLALRAFVSSDAAEALVPAWGDVSRAMLLAMTLFLLLAGTGMLAWTFFPAECAPWQGRRLRLLPPVIADEPTARRRAPRWLRHAFTGVVVAAWVLGFVGAIAAIMAADAAASPFVQALEALAVVPFVGLAGVATSAAVFGRRGARTVVAGVWLATAAVAHDTLLALGLVPGAEPVAVYAFFVFLVLISLAFADVFARNAREVTDLSRVLSERVSVRTRELEAASTAAQAANQAKTQFISAVSHELRTPLAAMLGYAQLLGDELDDTLTPTQREFFGVIQTSGDRLIALVSDLLDLALIESGRFDVRLGAVPLPEVVREVVRQVEPLARVKDLALAVGAVPDAAVLANAQRLRQVLLNVLSNAVKFTDDGHIGITIEAATLDGHPALAIAIADTGPGIEEAFRPHLFERFTQAPAAYDATQQGVGLGLALVHELVTRMQGTVDVTSEVGSGSVFTITLRLAETVENPRVAADA